MKEKAGLGALVDTREMRDFLAWGHVHIRITLSKAPGLTTLTIGLWMESQTRPTLGEIGGVLGVTPMTVSRDLRAERSSKETVTNV
jgi:hypothetical protein